MPHTSYYLNLTSPYGLKQQLGGIIGPGPSTGPGKDRTEEAVAVPGGQGKDPGGR